MCSFINGRIWGQSLEGNEFKMMRCILLILVCLGMFAHPIAATNDTIFPKIPRGEMLRVLSLKQAQEMALKQHPEIMSSDYQTQAADQSIEEEQANYYPQIQGSAVGALAKSTTRLAATQDIISAPTVVSRGSLGVSASQLITDFGRTGYLVDAAQSTRDAKEARSLSTRDRIVFAVTRSYFNVLRAQKIVHVAEATLKSRQIFFEQITELRKSELKSDLDVSLAQQNLDDVTLLILKSQNDLDDAYAELSETLGFSENIHFKLTDDRNMLPMIPDLASSLKKAAAQNPKIQELKLKVLAARKTVDAEQAAFYPTVKAIGYAGGNPSRNKQLLPANYAAAGVNLSVPIYTGGKLTASEKRAMRQMQALEKDLKTKENQLLRDVRLAWNNTQTAYKNIAVTKEFLQNSVKSLELMTDLYKLGKNSIVDLTQAQLNQTRAQITFANATYDYLISLALLKFYVRESVT